MIYLFSAYFFLHTDHLNSTNVVTDAAGLQVQLYEYEPYGQTTRDETVSSQLEAKTSYKFTGQEEDASTGLYYYHARYYDPELGRFVQADSIVQDPFDPQMLNRYSYCRNNPVNFVDPTGHFIIELISAIIVGALIGAATGALVGAAAAAGTGGNILKGAIQGAIIGAVVGGVLGGLAYAAPNFINLTAPSSPIKCAVEGGNEVLVEGVVIEGPTEALKAGTWEAIERGMLAAADAGTRIGEIVESIVQSVIAADSLAKLQGGLDAAGLADPTPICDGINACIYGSRGDFRNMGFSMLSMLPYAGDIVGKGAKYGGKFVLGRVGRYEEVADRIGADYFKLPGDVWDKMTDAQRWRKNRVAIKAALDSGKEIVLSNPVSDALSGSFFYKELKYLKRQGINIHKLKVIQD